MFPDVDGPGRRREVIVVDRNRREAAEKIAAHRIARGKL
jgi:hypothetical protein